MIYKQFQDEKLSMLGLGAMRLPVIDGNDSQINQSAVDEMVDYAMANGINYYDTAWGYHGGGSELAIGKALSKHPREKFFLATKFPGYDPSNMDKVEEIFEKQLEKCGVDYFDFYLFHNVCEMNIDAYLDQSHGVHQYLIKQKQNGRIKHLGFSAHGSCEVISRFLDMYGKDMEFCQLQINYIDWKFQQADKKVELLNQHNIPIWVMEPLRGGKLAQIPAEYKSDFASLRPEESPCGWAFSFLQALPDVKVILSGMSNLEQLKQNIETFKADKPLNGKEMDAVLSIADKMVSKIALPCTGCHYCTSHCPQQLDIPSLLELYNEHVFSGGGFLAPMALSAFPQDKRPNACVGCKSCEAVCPQQIKISEAMENFVSMLYLYL